MHRVFVYGTLKKHEPNHYLMINSSNGKAVFLGNAVTCKRFPLVIASKYNIPFLLFKEGEGSNIHGEVYDVDDNMLKILDGLEAHPTFYERLQEPVLYTDESDNPKKRETTCWIYFLKKYKPELISLPTMENYSSNGPHGCPYIDRCSRPINNDDLVSSVLKEIRS